MITHLHKSGKKVVHRMPFLLQPFPFIRAWDWHQETQKCVTNGWVACLRLSTMYIDVDIESLLQ